MTIGGVLHRTRRAYSLVWRWLAHPLRARVVGVLAAMVGIVAGGVTIFHAVAPDPSAPAAKLAGPINITNNYGGTTILDPRKPESTPAETLCRQNASLDGGGWGPGREMVPASSYSRVPAFNVDTIYWWGDERQFYGIRDVDAPDDSPWFKRLRVEPNHRYVVRVAAHNGAAPGDEFEMWDAKITVHLPVCTGRWIYSEATLKSSSAAPPAVWSGIAVYSDEERFNLAYVEGSAMYCFNSTSTCESVSTSFLTSRSQPIGSERLDGNFRGGIQNAGYLVYQVVPQFSSRSEGTG